MLLYFNVLSEFLGYILRFIILYIYIIYTIKYFVYVMTYSASKPSEINVFCIFAANLCSPTIPN